MESDKSKNNNGINNENNDKENKKDKLKIDQSDLKDFNNNSFDKLNNKN